MLTCLGKPSESVGDALATAFQGIFAFPGLFEDVFGSFGDKTVIGKTTSNLIDIGTDAGDFLFQAKALGFEIDDAGKGQRDDRFACTIWAAPAGTRSAKVIASRRARRVISFIQAETRRRLSGLAATTTH